MNVSLASGDKRVYRIHVILEQSEILCSRLGCGLLQYIKATTQHAILISNPSTTSQSTCNPTRPRSSLKTSPQLNPPQTPLSQNHKGYTNQPANMKFTASILLLIGLTNTVMAGDITCNFDRVCSSLPPPNLLFSLNSSLSHRTTPPSLPPPNSPSTIP